MTQALDLIRGRLSQWGVDAVLIPHEDAYLNEYPPAFMDVLPFVSGFTGSAGQAVITATEAALFVDARYTIQAKKQLDSKHWVSFLINDQRPGDWLSGRVKTVGYDPSCIAQSTLDRFVTSCTNNGIKAVAIPVGAVHSLMPRRNHAEAPVELFPMKYEGRAADEKIAALRAEMAEQKIDAALIADPTMASWLLGLRARLIPTTPQILGRVLLTDKDVFLQLDDVHGSFKKIPSDVTLVHALPSVDGMVGFDPDSAAPASLENFKNTKPIKGLFEKIRCAKTPQQRAVIKAVLRRDNKILDLFFKELVEYLREKSAYEHEIAEMIAAARAKHKLYVGESFDAIVGFRENGAIIHYRPEKGADKLVTGSGVLLIDCGGQYKDGTTDRTTTLLLGECTEAEKRAYAAVVKSHKTLAAAKFPAKTTGAQLDGIARAPLWAAGYDCPHGIGHGVGQFLSVHEGPFGISSRCHDALPEGLLVSNEPGVYVEGSFGIRHERLYFIEDVGGGMLGFKA